MSHSQSSSDPIPVSSWKVILAMRHFQQDHRLQCRTHDNRGSKVPSCISQCSPDRRRTVVASTTAGFIQTGAAPGKACRHSHPQIFQVGTDVHNALAFRLTTRHRLAQGHLEKSIHTRKRCSTLTRSDTKDQGSSPRPDYQRGTGAYTSPPPIPKRPSTRRNNKTISEHDQALCVIDKDAIRRPH